MALLMFKLPLAMESGGWVRSPVKVVGVKFNVTGREPRSIPGMPAPALISAAVLPAVAPVPLALREALAPQV